jgi:hypothetical protein
MRRELHELLFFLEPVIPVIDANEEDIDGMIAKDFDSAGDAGREAVGPAKLRLGHQRDQLDDGVTVIVDDKGGADGITCW